MKSSRHDKLNSVEILKPKTDKIIRRIFVLFVFFIILILKINFYNDFRRFFVPCPNMTKWEGKNCELYILDDMMADAGSSVFYLPPGILVYHDKNNKEYVYDVVFDRWNIDIYEHRENPNDRVDRVAHYDLNDVSYDENKAKYSLHYRSNEDVKIPEILKLKITEENLNIEDIPYKYCYGNPLFVIGSKNFSFSWGNDSFYLFIFDDNKTGTLTWKARETEEETEYNVTFDSEQIMTVYDKCTNEKIVSYYIYCQSNDEFYAIMKEKFDEKCTWKEYMVFS